LKTIEINWYDKKSSIFVGEPLRSLTRHLFGQRTVIITDLNVRAIYGHRFPPCPVIEIGTGESAKTLDTVREIYERLMNLEVDRSWFVVGIGGGVVCDVAGFAASTYMRGVRFGFVPSTLLSQVDASVGGKNGVNFHAFKNMVGTFRQPEWVMCDTALLKTLPKAELRSGLAEAIKTAAIGDEQFFSFMEERCGEVLDLEPEAVERVVYDAVKVKAAIVNRDAEEQGERRKLNFGHTLGHAIEKTSSLSHGEAVSLGMSIASSLSVKRGYLAEGEAARILNLLDRIGLPTRAAFDMDHVLDAVRRDKKRQGEKIRFVLLRKIGEALIEDIPLPELEEEIKNVNGATNSRRS
jgi:3-dehydroquinate synthase